MADDTNQTGAADRNQVAASEPYEVAYFAKKHGLTQKVARDLIAEIGNEREKLDAAAEARSVAGDGGAQSSSPRKKDGTAAKMADAGDAKPASTAKGARKRPARAKAAPASTGSPRGAASSGPVAKLAAAAAPVLDAFTEPLEAGTGAVRRRAAATVKSATKATKPITDSVRPAAGSLNDRAKTVASAARRSSAAARKRVAAAPAAVGKSAGKALDATKTAAKSRTAAVLGAAAAGLVTGLAVNLGRKVAVQAPSVMAGDWLEAVRLEHKMALGLFDAIEATSDAEPAKRTMLLIQLTHALSKHAFTEENVIYPALRDWGDKADADKLNHDHGYVKQHLYDLDAIDPATSAFLEKIATFRADLEAHIREEEDAVFPPLHAALGEAKNKAVTALANKEGFKLA